MILNLGVFSEKTLAQAVRSMIHLTSPVRVTCQSAWNIKEDARQHRIFIAADGSNMVYDMKLTALSNMSEELAKLGEKIHDFIQRVEARSSTVCEAINQLEFDL